MKRNIPRALLTSDLYQRHMLAVVAGLCCLLFMVAGSIVSVVQYWQYDAFYLDFGIFDQAIWEIAHFQAPIIEHFAVGGRWVFADHFYPTLFLLSPIYWFTTHQEALLIAQTVIVGISGFILFLIARKVLRNELLSLAILVCYFLFIGLQNAVITEFHDLTIMTLPLMLTFWAFINEKKRLYFLFLLLTLGCKESLFLLGITIGVAIFLLRRSWKQEALITIILSIIWGIITIKVIIPYFSGGIYQYGSGLPSTPQEYLTRFFDDPNKRHTLLFSFLSFGFLPVFSPAFWLAIFQDYATRFYPNNTITRWTLGLHYNAQSAVLLSLASVYGLAYLQRFKQLGKVQPILAVLLILNSLFLYRFILHGPFALSYNPAFYAHTKDFAFLNHLVQQIPKNAVVMTQNDLGSHFSHQRFWYLRYNYESKHPDYIVFDLRQGQNPNDFFGSTDVPKIFAKVKSDPNYTLTYHEGDQYVFKREVSNNRSLRHSAPSVDGGASSHASVGAGDLAFHSG